MQFPTFKYSSTFGGPSLTSTAFGKDTPSLTKPVEIQGGQQPFQPGKFSFDDALAYSIMQQADPKARAAARREELADLLTLQQEQMKQAAPYKLMFELPGQLTQAFALPGQIRLAGAAAANQVIAEGLRSASGSQMPPFAYQSPNIQYF